ncbi:MAG: hypothetical protein KKG54_07435 [Alphaproteobacteria bacterium]|uniref:hypothetical protein n=1 Tax=Brevundimonas sp. TaxID=1871086 RepID=UPI0017ED49DD|nr:hypothetical protein [Brevundimonas sp.]MBA3049132.1 hypothetical protein [Brevundimonas sp.]MBU3970618.1 hypothetical protein [Alphaproteobacteria bacterium]MBU4039140.1 hypothetical protein [Alphaproteobacteria bacterium]MBU4135115.1 hypothetical protein [Alphaproteobacteria bacterium]
MPMSRSLSIGLLVVAIAGTPVIAQAQTPPTLPTCRAGGQPVTLVIRTDLTSGWTVNGAPVAAVADPGYTNVAPATWIGPVGGRGPATLVYRVPFNAPTMHGQMSVSARWAADNCGGMLTAGTGTATAGSTSCTPGPNAPPNGQDFRAFNHITNAQFHPADSNNPTPSLTFTVANQPGSKTGLAGVFTITALCVCR